MRRIVLLAIMLFVLIAVAGANEFTPIEEDVTLYGYYYKPSGSSQDSRVYITITDCSENTLEIKQAETVMVVKNTTSTESQQFNTDVFNWTLTGYKYNGTATINFTFTALQAYIADTDMYYVPRHSFNMVLNQNSPLTVSESNLSSGFTHTGVGSYPYPEYDSTQVKRSITYTGSLSADQSTDYTWTVGGKASIDIINDFTMYGYVYHYISNVKVEFVVQ